MLKSDSLFPSLPAIFRQHGEGRCDGPYDELQALALPSPVHGLCMSYEARFNTILLQLSRLQAHLEDSLKLGAEKAAQTIVTGRSLTEVLHSERNTLWQNLLSFPSYAEHVRAHVLGSLSPERASAIDCDRFVPEDKADVIDSLDKLATDVRKISEAGNVSEIAKPLVQIVHTAWELLSGPGTTEARHHQYFRVNLNREKVSRLDSYLREWKSPRPAQSHLQNNHSSSGAVRESSSAGRV